MGKTWPKEEVTKRKIWILFWIQKSQEFAEVPFQCIFNEFGFLLDISSKINLHVWFYFIVLLTHGVEHFALSAYILFLFVLLLIVPDTVICGKFLVPPKFCSSTQKYGTQFSYRFVFLWSHCMESTCL